MRNHSSRWSSGSSSSSSRCMCRSWASELRATEDLVAHLAGEAVEARGLAQELPVVGRELPGPLRPEVVDDVGGVADVVGRQPGGLALAAQGEPGEPDPGRPPLEPVAQLGERLELEPDAHRGEQLVGLRGVEGEVRRRCTSTTPGRSRRRASDRRSGCDRPHSTRVRRPAGGARRGRRAPPASRRSRRGARRRARARTAARCCSTSAPEPRGDAARRSRPSKAASHWRVGSSPPALARALAPPPTPARTGRCRCARRRPTRRGAARRRPSGRPGSTCRSPAGPAPAGCRPVASA